MHHLLSNVAKVASLPRASCTYILGRFAPSGFVLHTHILGRLASSGSVLLTPIISGFAPSSFVLHTHILGCFAPSGFVLCTDKVKGQGQIFTKIGKKNQRTGHIRRLFYLQTSYLVPRYNPFRHLHSHSWLLRFLRLCASHSHCTHFRVICAKFDHF